MLIDFSLSNFRSFGPDQTLNLVASRAHSGHEDHRIAIPSTDQMVLRTGVIYGANAAGKSNLIRALEIVQDLVLGRIKGLGFVEPNRFRFSDDPSSPMSFEVRFMSGTRVFVYGFSVTPEEVTEEWLATPRPTGREADVFTRQGKKITIGDLKALGEENRTSANALKALQTLGVRPNQLFLERIVDLDDENRGELLSSAAWWFTTCLTVITPESSFGPLLDYCAKDKGFGSFASEFLGSIGTGIGELFVDETNIPADKLPKPIQDSLQEGASDVGPMFAFPNGFALSIDPNDPSKVVRRSITARHLVDGSNFSLPLHDESDGTQRFLNLLPALYHLQTDNRVYVIDELDRSLHPLLSRAIVEFFVTSCPEAFRQLIVTTHETHLLDLDLLRRDEIWFVEKDERQQSRIYSLAEMRVRKDLKIDKGYLLGRFGAIPFVGGLDRLQDLVDCPASEEPDAQATSN